MMTVLKVNTQIFKLLKLGMLHMQLLKTAHWVSLHYQVLQKSCCLLCVIISPWRVRSQLTPEEHFGKKSKCRVKL